MSESDAGSGYTPADVRERRRARRRASRNRVLLAIALVLAFAIGVALGQALHDNPRPGGEQTSLRTFPPLTQTGETGR